MAYKMDFKHTPWSLLLLVYEKNWPNLKLQKNFAKKETVRFACASYETNLDLKVKDANNFKN